MSRENTSRSLDSIDLAALRVSFRETSTLLLAKVYVNTVGHWMLSENGILMQLTPKRPHLSRLCCYKHVAVFAPACPWENL